MIFLKSLNYKKSNGLLCKNCNILQIHYFLGGVIMLVYLFCNAQDQTLGKFCFLAVHHMISRISHPKLEIFMNYQIYLYLSGGVITLVYLFCNAQDQTVREKSADVLCKMSGDKLMGPKVRIALSKFLPEVFLDAMKRY